MKRKQCTIIAMAVAGMLGEAVTACPIPGGTIVWHSNSTGTYDIWRMDSDGENRRRLTDSAGTDYNPAISPDCTQISFASDRNGLPRCLFVVDMEGANEQPLACFPDLYAGASSWTPDSAHVLFRAVAGCCTGGLFMVDRDGSNLTNQILDCTISGYVGHPFMHPDGSKIVYDKRTGGASYSTQIFDACPERQLTFGSPSESTTGGCGGYSPDGTEIVFTRGHGIWLMDANGDNQRPIDIVGGEPPSYPTVRYENVSWSPDGEWFVFDYDPGTGNQDIYIARKDGTCLTRLTFDPGADESPRWACPEILPLLDIKPGSCPNPLNRNSHGVVPVAVAGSERLDSTQIDVSSVVLSRADGVGGLVAPNEGPPGPHSVFEDVATSFEGEACECDDASGDGIMDLSMKFRTDDVVEILQLNDLNSGDEVELIVSGLLLDGTEFTTAGDCILIVPQGTSNAAVTSNTAGLYVELSPPDTNVDDSGFANFQRVYDPGTLITLTAPPQAEGLVFHAWQVDGVLQNAGETTIDITVVEDLTARAVYLSAKPGPTLGPSLAPTSRQPTSR